MPTEIQTQFVTITPEIADRLIVRSKAAGGLNRIKRSKVIRLAEEMSRGSWQINGESIIISETEKILDGHHRLEACVYSKTPFKTVLVTGAGDDVLDTIDTGFSRTISDALHLAGHMGPAGNLGAIGKAIGMIINNTEHDDPFGPLPPAHRIAEWLTAHAELEAECLTWITQVRKGCDTIPKADVAYLFLSGVLADRRDHTEQFLEKLASGFGIEHGDPAGVLRQFFLVDYPKLIGSRNKKQRPTARTVLGRMLKALQAAIAGERLDKLTFTNKESLPHLDETQQAPTSPTMSSTLTETVPAVPEGLMLPKETIEGQQTA